MAENYTVKQMIEMAKESGLKYSGLNKAELCALLNKKCAKGKARKSPRKTKATPKKSSQSKSPKTKTPKKSPKTKTPKKSPKTKTPKKSPKTKTPKSLKTNTPKTKTPKTKTPNTKVLKSKIQPEGYFLINVGETAIYITFVGLNKQKFSELKDVIVNTLEKNKKLIVHQEDYWGNVDIPWVENGKRKIDYNVDVLSDKKNSITIRFYNYNFEYLPESLEETLEKFNLKKFSLNHNLDPLDREYLNLMR